MNKKINSADVLGTWLASKLGLNSRYFTNIYNSGRLTLDGSVKIKKFGGLIFVSVPPELKKYLDGEYISTKISADDDIAEYEYIFNLTKDTKIGFWR
jgi:hypothetical protein